MYYKALGKRTDYAVTKTKQRMAFELRGEDV